MALRTLKRSTSKVFAARARAWFLLLLEVNVLRSEHIIYHKNHSESLIYGVYTGYLRKKSVSFHSWGRILIPDSFSPEMQAV